MSGFVSRTSANAVLAAMCILVLCTPAWALQGKTVEAATVPDMVEALNDPTVTNVVLTAPVYNLTEESMPYNAVVISGRDVTLEGATQPDGSLVYMDANALGARVLVDNSSTLVQKNIWVDDCILDGFPFTCFATPGPNGGRINLRDAVFSDATCARMDESVGLTNMLASAKLAQGELYKEKDLNDRETLIIETGWVPYAVDNAEWRMYNVTVSCTAGVTHPLADDGKGDSPAPPVPPASSARAATAWAVAGLAVAAAVFF